VEWLSLPMLSAGECERIVTALRDAAGGHAPVYGVSGAAESAAVQPLMRRVTKLEAPESIRTLVRTLLADAQPQLAEHFQISVTRFEEPQFLRYVEGDFFVAHQDGNTPVIRDDSMHRRISVSLFLSDPADYAGGALVFRDAGAAPCARGTLLAFRSELTHEVRPVERGERYTVVTWYR
jgi:SM-20-related protein